MNDEAKPAKQHRLSQDWVGALLLASMVALIIITLIVALTIYEIRSDESNERERIVCMETKRTDCR